MKYMKYPKIFRKINNFLGVISGSLVLAVALINVYEVICRGVFNRPTGWTMDVSTYLLLWIIFSGVAYSLQVKGQVSTEMIRVLLRKLNLKLLLRIIAIACYLVGMVVAGVFLYCGIYMTKIAIMYNRLTVASAQIHQAFLTVSLIVGGVLLSLTLIFIIIDILGGNDQYI